MAPPYVQYESRILYGQGIDVFKELLDLSVDKGLIEKSSSWYQLGTFKVQGDAKAAEYLRENEELANELRAELLKDEPDNESDSTTEGS
jgi:recombination protein RecA